MKKEDVLSMFFSRSYEKQLNEKVLDDIDYVVDEYGVLNYVANVIDVPFADFINYVLDHPSNESIQSNNITQSSCFAACEREMIDVFLSENNRGLDFISIGKHFTKYVRSNKDAAFRKYGENQVKTCAHLGLAFEYFKHWYLNSVGYIYNELGEEDKMSLLARNILREPLYAKMINDIMYHDIDLISYMDCLDSDDTKARRYESVKYLLDICLNECNKEGIKIYKVLNTKEALQKKIKEKKKKKEISSYNSLFPLIQTSIFDDYSGYMAAENQKCPFDDYLRKMTSLRCYKKKGKSAPYKAIMILSVINLIEKGIITDNHITASSELKKEYYHLSEILDYDRTLFNPPFDLPFIHLGGEGFWHIKPSSSYTQMKDSAINKISDIEYVTIDDDLYNYLLEPEKRDLIKRVLISSYLKS